LNRSISPRSCASLTDGRSVPVVVLALVTARSSGS
jgi:hypothetical protein